MHTNLETLSKRNWTSSATGFLLYTTFKQANPTDRIRTGGYQGPRKKHGYGVFLEVIKEMQNYTEVTAQHTLAAPMPLHPSLENGSRMQCAFERERERERD